MAQGTSAEYPLRGDEESSPRRSRSIRDTMERMRIERDKKEYDEMIARGDELLLRTTRLAKIVETSGAITDRQKSEISAIEKLAKQIRKQLGGDDDDYESANHGPMSGVNAVNSLKAATIELTDELKKISRFSISAAAIQGSNEVLRIARYLRSSTN